MIIGLTGHAGAGKDTVAMMLNQYGFVQLAFADALRAEVAEAWRIDTRLLTERHTKEWPIEALAFDRCDNADFTRLMAAQGRNTAEPRSAREVMQLWGTEYRRGTDDGYWVKRLWAKVIMLQENQGFKHFVVSDVRFLNEAGFLGFEGGYTWRVERPGTAPVRSHASEQEQERIVADEIIDNSGSLEHLAAQVDALMVEHRRHDFEQAYQRACAVLGSGK